MRNKGPIMGLAVFLSIILIIGIVWYLLDDQRAALAQNYLDQGTELEKAGDFKSAYYQYKKAGIATPRSFAPYYHQGTLLKKINQTERATQALEKSSRYARAEMAPTFALAKIYYDQKDYQTAQSYFDQCLGHEPDNSELYYWLGRCQMNQNNLSKAEESFKTAIEFFPSANYHLYLGLTLAYKDIDSAQEELENYYKKQNLSFSDLDKKTVLGVSSEYSTDIKIAFDRMMRTESSATKRLLLGQLLNQIGESGLAVAKFKELTEDFPEMRDGYLYLGYAYLLENQPDPAIKVLDTAAELDPTNALTFEILSKAYQQKGETAQAREMLLKSDMLQGEEIK